MLVRAPILLGDSPIVSVPDVEGPYDGTTHRLLVRRPAVPDAPAPGARERRHRARPPASRVEVAAGRDGHHHPDRPQHLARRALAGDEVDRLREKVEYLYDLLVFLLRRAYMEGNEWLDEVVRLGGGDDDAHRDVSTRRISR